MKNTTIYRYSFIPIFLASCIALAQIGGGSGVGGFPTQDYTFTGALTSGTLTAEDVTTQKTVPEINLIESDSSSDESWWRFASDAGSLYLQSRTDADGAGNNVIRIDRTGTNADSVNFFSDAFTINNIDMTPAEGSFTLSVNGCTTTPTPTIDYTRIGNIITYTFMTGILCTSDATNFNGLTVPAGARPVAGSTGVCPIHATNGGTVTSAGIIVSTGGTMTFQRMTGTAYSSTGWSTSGSKGIPQGTTCVVVDNDAI